MRLGIFAVSFSSVLFLFAYLPVMLLLYFGASRLFKAKGTTVKNAVLLAGSIAFYALGQKSAVIYLVVFAIFNYFAALWAGSEYKCRKALYVLTLIIDVSGLFLFKYYDFFVSEVFGGRTGLPTGLSGLAPLGISFFTFQAVSYITDVYLKKVSPEKNFLNAALYMSAFWTVTAGPILRYETVFKELRDRKEDFDCVSDGVKRFVYGLIKKVLIADSLALVADRIFKLVNSGEAVSVLLAWLGAIVYTLEIYYDFSGYSDMAIGLGKMFGFTVSENFDYPYTAATVKEFWRKWHISLSSWFRDYIYIPLGGSRKGAVRTCVNLFAVWLLTGLWHGAGYTFIAWGLMYFIVLMFERITGYGDKWKLPKAFMHIATMIVVSVGWVIFRSPDITSAYRYLRRMIGLGTSGLVCDTSIRFLLNNIILLVIAVIFTMPVIRKLEKKKGILQIALGILLLICCVYVIKGGYSPFIYFTF